MLKQSRPLKEINEKSHKIILSFGSNIGNSQEIINCAINLMQDIGIISLISRSSFFFTEPSGYNSLNWFYNISVSASTTLSYNQFLFFIKSIEYQFGRKPEKLLSDRKLDIDILFYDDYVISAKYITIPHPKLHERNFVLIPTNEIEPDFVHPIFNKTITELLHSTHDILAVNKTAI